MKLETKPNRKFNGKRDSAMPFAAHVDGEVIAVGENATDAKDRAIAELMDVYAVQFRTPAIRIASDGTVWMAREYRKDLVEVVHYYQREGKPVGTMRDGGSCSGYRLHVPFYGKGCETVMHRSVQDVLDYRMLDYEDAIAPPKIGAFAEDSTPEVAA